MKRIAILGSTGSIGTQALEVIRLHPDKFIAEVLTARTNTELLIKQSREFIPNCVVIADEKKYESVKNALADLPIKVYSGINSVSQVVEMDSVDVVVAGIVGFAGLNSALNAARAGKIIALANKEALVIAGELLIRTAQKNKAVILPVDSEHSAIFQCLIGEPVGSIDKIFLTASGGPFRGKTSEKLLKVTFHDALKHPNWKMGSKVTIDSSSLMNKGLEMIEAKWLFNLKPEQIEVVVHPQSIIHSMVQFKDGSIKAQMSLPDMRFPIQYAMSFPERLENNFPKYDFTQSSSLTFEPADKKTFRNLALAADALAKGGNMPCILNAANEIAVEAFLKEKLGFLQMSDVIEKCMQEINFIKSPAIEDYFYTDEETRKLAQQLIN